VRPSTIVDVTRSEPAVLREGAVATDEVIAVANGDLGPGDVAPVVRADAPGDDLDDAEPA
jgi:hypothetical protein